MRTVIVFILSGGHLLCGARCDGMLRPGKGNDARAYDDVLRRKLLAAAIEFVRSLPAK